MRQGIAIVVMVLLPCFVLAQTIEQTRATMIRNSPEFRHGEGYGETIEAAKEAAVKELSQSIRTLVHAEQTGTITETETALSDSFASKTTLVSMVQLQGLQYLDLGLSEGRHRALAYITIEELEASNRRQKARVRSLFANAESARSNADIGKALQDAYSAYLLAHTLADTLTLAVPNPSSDPKYDLLIYLQTLLDEVEFRASPAKKLGSIYSTRVSATYHGKPIQSLNLSYYGGAGQDFTYVADGVCDVILHLTPPLPAEHVIKLQVEYADVGTMMHQDDLSALHNVFRERSFGEATHTLRIAVEGGVATHEPPPPPDPKPRVTHRVTPEPGRLAPPPAQEVEFAPRSGMLVIPDNPMPQWPMPIVVLSQPELASTGSFLEVLQRYADRSLLSYAKDGPSSLRAAGMDVYVTLATRDSVLATLHCDGDQFHDIRKDVRYSELTEPLGEDGNAFQIWIGVPDENR